MHPYIGKGGEYLPPPPFKQGLDYDTGILCSLADELTILHPSIALFHGACIDPDACRLALVFELESVSLWCFVFLLTRGAFSKGEGKQQAFLLKRIITLVV